MMGVRRRRDVKLSDTPGNSPSFQCRFLGGERAGAEDRGKVEEEEEEEEGREVPDALLGREPSAHLKTLAKPSASADVPVVGRHDALRRLLRRSNGEAEWRKGGEEEERKEDDKAMSDNELSAGAVSEAKIFDWHGEN